MYKHKSQNQIIRRVVLDTATPPESCPMSSHVNDDAHCVSSEPLSKSDSMTATTSL